MRFIIRLKHYFHFLWDLLVINVRLLWGMWKLTRLPQPAITVFGGARVKSNSKYAQLATDLAKLLAANGFSIITGGGPGIMEAANYGAFQYARDCKVKGDGNECKPIMSAGIGVIHLNLEKKNSYMHEQIVMSHFFSRKWLLVRYAVGFVIFPGGFGTLDELFEIITLRQTKRMQIAPVILIDSEYWQPIMDWAYEKAFKNGLISQEDIDLITITDSVEQATALIKKHCLSSK